MIRLMEMFMSIMTDGRQIQKRDDHSSTDGCVAFVFVTSK